MPRAPRKKPTHTLPNERPSEQQAGDLAALRRMMQASSGTFSLSFALCHDPALQQSLIQELRAEFPRIVVITLPEKVGDVFHHVHAIVPPEVPDAIFILGMESSIPFEGDLQPAIAALNSSREQWERFHCPIVFWLADYALARLARHAPDFWRYRSHQFEFIPDDSSLEKAKLESFPGHEMIDALPYEEKRFRLSELETRLRDIGPNPAPDLLPHAVSWSYELAKLYQHSSRFAEAERLLRETLDWQTTAHGEAASQSVVTLSNLAQLLKATNRLAEAEPLMRRALAIGEASFGKDHPNVAIRLNNLAQVLKDTNRLAEAEPMMRRALTILEHSLGKDHPTVASSLNNLAVLLQETNRLAEAEPLMRRAIAIDEASFGNDHPDVAFGLNNLATLLKATNRLAEAEPLMKDALRIFENSLGSGHPNTVLIKGNLQILQDAIRAAKHP